MLTWFVKLRMGSFHDDLLQMMPMESRIKV